MLSVRVLGPTEIAVDDDRRPLGGPIPRALIVMLALREGGAVHDDLLLETAWGGKVPSSGRHALDVYVSNLRKAVAPAATIVRSGQGFALLPVEGSAIRVDAVEFTAQADEARKAVARSDLDAARDTIDDALALWRGRPFTDLPASDEWTIESARLEALHRELLQARAECRVAAGDLSGIAELEAFAEQDAYDEATQMRLMRALYVAGRQQDALDVFRSYGRRVRTELGLEPSETIVALERAVLNHRLGAVGGSDRPRRSQRVFGRDALIAQVSSLFSERARVVSLIGMGGIGKTTAAIAVADELAEAGHRVIWISAAELTGADVPSWIAQEITGLRNADPYDIRVEGDVPRLLVLDSFEGREEEARYLDFLVSALPSVRILITSRRPSRVAAEWVVQVPPLDPPADDARTVSELRESPAGALFAELIDRRAHDALDEAGAVATAVEICRRLAGIPLALELAAARVGVLSLDELGARLDISSLVGGATATPTHRSMTRVLDSTVTLLSTTSRRVLEVAGVFRSPFRPADAATVAGLPESRVEASFSELYDAGLIVRSRQWTGTTYFTLLGPIREYAAEALRVEGSEPSVRSRHLAHIVARTKELVAEFAVPGTQVQAVVRFDAMRPDFAAALDYAIAENRVPESIDLACDARAFWSRLSAREGLAWINRVRSLDLAQEDQLRLQRVDLGLLHIAGMDEALAVSESILASGAATLRDRQHNAAARADLGDARAATGLLEAIAVEARDTGETLTLLQSLSYLCRTYLMEGEVEKALERAAEVDAVLESSDTAPIFRAYVRMFQTPAYVAAGDERTAALLLREGLTIGFGAQDANVTPNLLLLTADLAITRSDEQRGLAIAATAVDIHARAGVSRMQMPHLPGTRVAAMVDGPAELTFAEAVDQAHAVLDEILEET